MPSCWLYAFLAMTCTVVSASSLSNVEAPPIAGVQLTEGPLAAEVPADIHPGALSSNARAGAAASHTGYTQGWIFIFLSFRLLEARRPPSNEGARMCCVGLSSSG